MSISKELTRKALKKKGKVVDEEQKE